MTYIDSETEYCMTRQQPAHYSGDRRQAGLQKKMDVIGHQCPGITASGCFRDDSAETFNKIIAIVAILEDSLTLYSANNYMM
jgi:hypothetical protein